MFKKMTNLETLKNEVNSSELSFVYFGQPGCSVCHGLKPQVENKLKSFQEEVNFLEVNTLDIPEVAGEFSVMTVPVVILFVEGKEYLRRARFVPIKELYEDVNKIVQGVTQK